ncbi:hypothetical protein GGR50DRAFT_529621 [Xylaria sp. CBS 124048]|nr:hypothetical protein GGR50DRAFT_529621 [Xylaria sp. CBS 124048]
MSLPAKVSENPIIQSAIKICPIIKGLLLSEDESDSSSEYSSPSGTSEAAITTTSTSRTDLDDTEKPSAQHSSASVQEHTGAKPSLYWKLPIELRLMILSFALPRRIIVIANNWCLEHTSGVPRPPMVETFKEWADEIDARTCLIRLTNAKGTLLDVWWNQMNDKIYFPSMQIMDQWNGWTEPTKGCSILQGATVLANILELIEDEYRGALCSDVFAKYIKAGVFNGVKAFELVLLTIQCDADLKVYEDERAIVNLYDESLVDLIKPAYKCMRTLSNWPEGVRYVTPGKLVKHLKGQWEEDLEWLFEEQWLRNQPVDWTPDMSADGFVGYQGRHPTVNRSHWDVERLIRRMPEIRPVIMFEKKCPEDFDARFCYGHRRRHWNQENHREDFMESIWYSGRTRRDGLEAISNRRGMFLSLEQKAGRITLV